MPPNQMTKDDSPRVQSSQAKNGGDMSSNGFASRAQSAGDRASNAESLGSGGCGGGFKCTGLGVREGNTSDGGAKVVVPRSEG